MPISIENVVGRQAAKARGRATRLPTPGDLSEAVRKAGVDIDRAGIGKSETGIRGVWDYELVALARVLRVSVPWMLRSGRKRRP